MLCLFIRSVLLVYQEKVYFTKMGNIYTVGPNEALIVSGRHMNVTNVVGTKLVNSLHGKGAEIIQRRCTIIFGNKQTDVYNGIF